MFFIIIFLKNLSSSYTKIGTGNSTTPLQKPNRSTAALNFGCLLWRPLVGHCRYNLVLATSCFCAVRDKVALCMQKFGGPFSTRFVCDLCEIRNHDNTGEVKHTGKNENKGNRKKRIFRGILNRHLKQYIYIFSFNGCTQNKWWITS